MKNRGVLAIILVSYTMIVLDISIVITGLPEIQRSLGFTDAGLSWVQNAYTLAFGGLLLLGARAGDLFGRRRMFIIGLGVFTAASMGVGAAQSQAFLLGSRALQGVGAAILAPSTLALLQTHFAEGPDRTRAVAWYAAVAGVASSLGLVLGGILTDLISWRVGFFINLPIGAALMLASPRYIKESGKQRGKLDVVGALTSTAGMISLVYGLVRSADAGWGDTVTIATIAIGVLLLGTFVLVEAKAVQPIMPLRLFAHRERAGAYLGRVLFLAGMVPFWFFMTQFLQVVKGYRPIEAGLAFLPTTLPNFAAAMLVPRLTRRFGHAQLAAASLLLSVAGMYWLGRVSASTPYVTGVALPMILVGVGQGGALGPLTASGGARVSANDAGAASGLVNVAHQLGGSLGLGALVVVAAFAASTGAMSPVEHHAHQIGAALRAAAFVLAAALVVVVLFIVRHQNANRVEAS